MRGMLVRKGTLRTVYTNFRKFIETSEKDLRIKYHLFYKERFDVSGTSDKGPSEIGMTSLQRTLVAAPC